ncbi:MAG TPA: M20/M25/M40 family metallo-hydrolase [Steroidobacteraceae bacterium]|nr:M20/M25/M40 family metallo-hydrolase [Steroidobacteraceae bacterium]
MRIRKVAAVAAFVLSSTATAADRPDPHEQARDIFKQLIEIKTTESALGSTPAAEAMAQRLLAGGFAAEDVQVVGPGGRKQNMVVRLKGTGRKRPVLLIGHLDVVEARREEWTVDPFVFLEKDGYFYGRGTQDMKDGIAVMVTTLLRYRAEGYRPERDIILALTADEESGTANGVDWLLKNRRDLVDADFVINHDGGGVTAENGRAVQIDLTASEKGYADFDLTVTNPGGHSSAPPRENAIYSLARALDRISAHDFAFELNNVTRAYFEHVAKRADAASAAAIRGILQTPPDAAAVKQLSEDQIDNAIFRTTCVATRLSGGHANNALPQTATANVNCRILPGHSPEEVRQELVQVVADPLVKVRYYNFLTEKLDDVAPDARGYSPPPLRPDVLKPLQKIAAKMWPGAPIVPSMAIGASDSIYTNAAGLPTYMVSGSALARDDYRAHGQDERIGVQSFYTSVDFFYDYLKAVVAYR